MSHHLTPLSLSPSLEDTRSGGKVKVISAVVPGVPTEGLQCGSIARFRLMREGTDPASRGLVLMGRARRGAGGRP